jgi:hypothetical protein
MFLLALSLIGDQSKSAFASLNLKFAELKADLAVLERESAELFDSSNWTIEREAKWLRKVDPIREQMLEIANQMTVVPSENNRDILAKAKVLLEMCREETDDNIARLACSLCKDITRGPFPREDVRLV